jgi:hypothetical protein
MTVAAASSSLASRSLRAPLSQVLAAGLAGGAIDFVYASVIALSRGRPVTTPWRSVASGWIGKAAAEGAGPVVLGVATHFAIAVCMAAAYLHLARRAPIVAARPWATAPLYGLALYVVMYMGVVPLRFGAPWQWRGTLSILDILAHVGVALAIVAVAERARAQTASAR